jgi:hypothetical protein
MDYEWKEIEFKDIEVGDTLQVQDDSLDPVEVEILSEGNYGEFHVTLTSNGSTGYLGDYPDRKFFKRYQKLTESVRVSFNAITRGIPEDKTEHTAMAAFFKPKDEQCCPTCGSRMYVGLNDVECPRGCNG